jgi:hypothetical protein
MQSEQQTSVIAVTAAAHSRHAERDPIVHLLPVLDT